jgi:arylsulfatase A-like enzyme
MPGSAIRKGDFKLIKFYDPENTELYNLKNDLGETLNIASDNLQKVRELELALDDWIKKMDPVMFKLNPQYIQK